MQSSLYMQGGDINQSLCTPIPNGKFTEFGRSLCGCCSSKGNKSKSNELTKPETITVQPSSSNITTLKKDVFIDGEYVVTKNTKVEANTAVSDNKPQENGNISPHTAKRLKEDCSNVTTLTLNDLIGTSDNTAQIDHISTSEQSVYNMRMHDKKQLLKSSKRMDNLNGEEDSVNLYGDSNETTNSTKSAHMRANEPNYSSPFNSIYGNGSLELALKDDENEDEMDDITDILHETSSSNVNLTNALVDSHPQKPPRLSGQLVSITEAMRDTKSLNMTQNQHNITPTAAKTTTTTKRAKSDFIVSTQNNDETFQQYIPSIAIQQATPLSATSNERFRFRYDNQALQNHISVDNQLYNDTDRQNIETSETSNIGERDFSENEMKQFEMKKMNDDEIVVSSERIDAKVNTNQEKEKPSKRPTHMYSSSSSSSDDQDGLNGNESDNDNVTRISVKSQGDATVKSTTLNGEIVSVQLAPCCKFNEIADEIVTDDEFNERYI